MGALTWHGKEKAAHTRAMGAPQAFPLSGDGAHVATLFDVKEPDPALRGVRLAEARYRDWREQGELFLRRGRVEAATAPFSLEPERDTGKPDSRAQRVPEGPGIVRELLAIIEDSGLSESCAVEVARAKAYLAREKVAEAV